MRYYVTADVHGYFTEFKEALTEAGFFEDAEPHKLIICGDLFDRGSEALQLQEFLDIIEFDFNIICRTETNALDCVCQQLRCQCV